RCESCFINSRAGQPGSRASNRMPPSARRLAEFTLIRFGGARGSLVSAAREQACEVRDALVRAPIDSGGALLVAGDRRAGTAFDERFPCRFATRNEAPTGP